jgi:hypothetical protein
VIEPLGASAASRATHTLPLDATTTNASNRVTDAGWPGIRLIRPLVAINLLLVALQPISAGLFLSGYGRAVTIHAVVALALLLGVLVQAVIAVVSWRRRGVPGWVAGVSLVLFVVVFFQHGLGYNKVYWLHVPIGVGLFGWLIRLRIRLDNHSSSP